MKIELTCPHCEAILRVGAEHSGKQLRCPSCQKLTPIPDESPVEVVKPQPGPSKFSAPLDDFSNPAPEYINPASSSDIHQEILSLIFGIIGIVMNFSCFCFIPLFVVLNLFGLFSAYQSHGPLRLAALLTNAIALLVAAGKLLFYVMAFVVF